MPSEWRSDKRVKDLGGEFKAPASCVLAGQRLAHRKTAGVIRPFRIDKPHPAPEVRHPPRQRTASGEGERLPLGELEGPAGLGTAVFLALDGATVARQETALLEDGTQIRLEGDHGAREAMAHGARLTR